ncbi:MAG: hypothetical protein HKN43_12175 [Rhodothermales bacterium]|nr:hypothetical protein [Rhodothermales bacterium]
MQVFAFSRIVILVFVLTSFSQFDVSAQARESKSAGKAALLSIVLPGLGHRYVNDSRWNTRASFLVMADVTTWLGITESSWRRNQSIDSYTVLAASRAAADVEGKDRQFFLNLATYSSSDSFLESALRNRAWDQIDYVSDASFQWAWETDEDFAAYRRLRERTESLERRRSVLVAVLVANRAFSGITSMLAVRRHNSNPVSMSATVLDGSPAIRIDARF